MQLRFWSRATLSIGVSLVAGTGVAGVGPARPAGWVRPPVCQPEKLHRIFPQEEGVYLLLLPLSGVENSDAELGARVTQELTEKLPTWAGKELDADVPKDMPKSQQKSAVETLRCTVVGHAEAERVGRAAGATAVVWGRANCMLPDSAACRKLPLHWELPTATAGSPGNRPPDNSHLRLALTVVRETPVNAFAAALPRAWRFADLDLPSHNETHAHALLDEVAGFWALRDLLLQPGLRLLLRARPYVADGEPGEALLDAILGEVYALLGQTAEAKQAMEHALAQCATDNQSCRFASLYRLGMLEAQLGNTDQAIARLTDALGVTERLKDPRGQREIFHSLAVLEAEMGHLRPSLKLFERGLAQSEASHDLDGQAEELRSLVYVYAHLGEVAQAQAYSDKALLLYQRLGNSLGQLSVLNQLGMLYAGQDLPERAEQVLSRALTLAQKLKLPAGESTVLSNLAMVYQARGDLGRAIPVMQEALKLAEQVHNVAGQATARSSLGTFYLGQNDLVRAETNLTAALALRKKARDRQGEAYTRRSLGYLRQLQGRRDEAYKEFEQALRLQSMGGNMQEYGGLVLDLGNLLVAQGKHEQAIAWFREALPGLEKSQLREAELTVRMRLAEVYEGRSEVAQAVETLESALVRADVPAARLMRRELLRGLGQLLAEIGRPTEAIARYQEAAATCTDAKESDTRNQLLAASLDLALEHGDKAAAEKVVTSFRRLELPLEVQLAVEAQFLGRTHSPDAAAKYQYISYLANRDPNSPTGPLLSRLASAGLSRIRHAGAWRDCSGFIITNVDDATLPVEAGDVVLRIQGQCLSGTASLQRASRQALKAPALKIELWRRDELLEVMLPGGKVPFVGSPF